MTDPIPPDVERVAKGHAQSIRSGESVEGIIARALMTERRRCAEVARGTTLAMIGYTVEFAAETIVGQIMKGDY